MQYLTSITPGKRLTFTTIWQSWKNMTSDAMSKYMGHHGKGCTFMITVSKSEVVLMPPAYIVCERAQGESAVGRRIAMLAKPHHQELLKALSEADLQNKPLNTSGVAPSAPVHTVLRMAVQD